MKWKTTILPLALVLTAGASTLLAQAAKPAASPAAAPAAAAPGTAPAAGAAPGVTIEPARPTAGPTTYDTVPGVEEEMAKLNDAQKKLALKIMNEERCTCGCGFTVAGCRHKDQKCPVSPGLAKTLIADLQAGKSEAELRKAFAPKPTPPPPPPLDTKINNFDLTGAPVHGPKEAKVTIVEFSDFQCPFCSQATAWVNDVMAAYPKDVKVVFKQYPLPMHSQANFAAQASLAAHAQGKFWDLHDKMFANFRTLSPDNIKEWAKGLGLDMPTFTKALDDGTYKAKVEKEIKEGSDAGVQGTPSFFVNGKRYNGQRDIPSIKKIIDDELKAAGSKPAASASETKTDAKAPAAKAATKPKTDKPASKTGADGN